MSPETANPLSNNLGNIGSLVTHGANQQLAERIITADDLDKETRELIRFGARAHGRHLLSSLGIQNAVSGCGLGLRFGRRTCTVVKRQERPTGGVVGICACGSALTCPVCAPRVGSKRVDEVQKVDQWHRGKGGIGHLLTFTMPHKKGEALGNLVRDFNRARQIAFKGRNYSRLADLRVGYVASHECNWSERSGWHFHRHEYVLGAYSSSEYSFIHERWMEGLRSVDRYNPSCDEHAFDAEKCDRNGASYVSKIGFEIAYAPAKESASLASLIVWDWAQPMSTGLQWVDGLFGIRGVNSVRGSKGLWSAAGVRVESDEDAAADAFERGDELLGDLEAWQYAQVIIRRKEFALRVAAQGGANEVNKLLRSINAGELIKTHRDTPDRSVGQPIGQLTLC